ncbi:MAG: FtsQ-type POTRA domain-containing protein [Clostridia bacterium]|nr:FtsQ-type POTRA domain-containing protein [Clostridia bacterium]
MQSEVNKRRVARQKKTRKRRLKIALIFFLIIALITLAILCFTYFFPVKRISITGSKIYTKSQIVKASGLTTDDQLFTLSQDKIESDLRKSLPYIDSVKIKRVLPDAVVINVTDAKEQAFYKKGKTYNTISDKGYILKQQNKKPENLFEIVTSGIDGKVGTQAKYKNSAEQELVQNLITELTKQKITIDKIDVSNILEISVNVEDRFTVIIGSDEYLSEKIAHLASMIDSIADRSGKINLSMWTPQNSQGTFIEDKN